MFTRRSLSKAGCSDATAVQLVTNKIFRALSILSHWPFSSRSTGLSEKNSGVPRRRPLFAHHRPHYQRHVSPDCESIAVHLGYTLGSWPRAPVHSTLVLTRVVYTILWTPSQTSRKGSLRALQQALSVPAAGKAASRTHSSLTPDSALAVPFWTSKLAAGFGRATTHVHLHA